MHNFSAGVDEEWFRLVHVTIEAQAAPAVAAILPMKRAAEQVGVAGGSGGSSVQAESAQLVVAVGAVAVVE